MVERIKNKFGIEGQMIEGYDHPYLYLTNDIINDYTSFEWRPLCGAVSCLDMELESGPNNGEATSHRGRVDAEPVPMFVPKASLSPGRVVEAVGIEP